MKKIQKCLFPVAGYGTRFLPFTKVIPKEMLPILAKPIIHYGVDEALDADINNAVMIISKGKESIQEYFSKSNKFNYEAINKKNQSPLKQLLDIIKKTRFIFIEQKEMLGLGHAILLGKESINNESFAVLLPDDIFELKKQSVLKKMTQLHNAYPNKCIIAVEEVSNKMISNYGIIDGEIIYGSKDLYKVSSLIEKPRIDIAPSNLAVIGRYILIPEIFNVLESIEPDSLGEIQITDALNILAKEDKVLALKVKRKRFDCGNVKGFTNATSFFYKNYKSLLNY